MSPNGSAVGEYVWLDTVGRMEVSLSGRTLRRARDRAGSDAAWYIRQPRLDRTGGGASPRQEVAPRCHVGRDACRLALGLT
jgi:hypothetical protein